MVDTLFPEEVESVPDMVDFFLNELTLAITVYFLRHIVSLISSSGRAYSTSSFPFVRVSQSVPLPLGEVR